MFVLYSIPVLYQKIGLLKTLKKYKRGLQVLDYVYNIDKNNKQNIKNYLKLKKEFQLLIMDNYQLKNHHINNPYVLLIAVSKYDKEETDDLQGTINDVLELRVPAKVFHLVIGTWKTLVGTLDCVKECRRRSLVAAFAIPKCVGTPKCSLPKCP